MASNKHGLVQEATASTASSKRRKVDTDDNDEATSSESSSTQVNTTTMAEAWLRKIVFLSANSLYLSYTDDGRTIAKPESYVPKCNETIEMFAPPTGYEVTSATRLRIVKSCILTFCAIISDETHICVMDTGDMHDELMKAIACLAARHGRKYRLKFKCEQAIEFAMQMASVVEMMDSSDLAKLDAMTRAALSNDMALFNCWECGDKPLRGLYCSNHKQEEADAKLNVLPPPSEEEKWKAIAFGLRSVISEMFDILGNVNYAYGDVVDKLKKEVGSGWSYVKDLDRIRGHDVSDSEDDDSDKEEGR